VSGQYDDDDLIGGNLTSYMMAAEVGRHYVAMTAINTNGEESGMSNEVFRVAE
jgi:hypothetical protein